MLIKLVIFLGVILGVTYGAHFILYKAIVGFFAITSPPLKFLLFIVLSLLSASFIASFFLLQWRENGLTVGFYMFAATWTAWFINLLLAVGLTWLFIGISRFTGLQFNIRIIAVVCFILAAVYSAYGIRNAFHPKIKNIDVEIKSLPSQWKNKTLVQLSDIHLGHVYRIGYLKNLVDKVNALDPDLVFITGDLFDGMISDFAHFAQPLKRLNANKGVYFITGNHETYVGVWRALRVLSHTKINILQNEVVDIGGLEIVGIGYPGVDGIEDIKNLKNSDGNPSNHKPRILLFHTPTNIHLKPKEDGFGQHFATYWIPDTSFAMATELKANLQLSGHTHKGQIFPFNYLTRLIYNGYDYGLHKNGNLTIYTTSGVGTWGPPMRTGNSPEIVVITLK